MAIGSSFRSTLHKMAFFQPDQFGFTDYRTAARITWSALAIGALAAIAASAVSVTNHSFSSLAVLFSVMAVSALAGIHELRLPKTKFEIMPGTVLAIWSVFWFGPGSGVLVIAAAAAAEISREKTLKASSLFKFFTSVVSITVPGYLLLNGFERYSGVPLDPTMIENAALIVAGCAVMTVANCLIKAILEAAFLAARQLDSSLLRQAVIARTVQTISEFAAASIIALLFVRFGLEFGFVLGPTAVLAVIAYRMHLASLEQKTAEILDASRIHLATVEALANAIDARDQVGAGHVKRTQLFAIGLGNELSLSDNEIDALRTAALLLDIGKLAVPDHILGKPGPLTPAEIDKTKIHSQVGASILEKVGFRCPVVPAVQHHHEHWDGSGYPDGLRGEEIPVTARILAIADTYDSLRSARPFRPAMSREKAREHLQKWSGSRFDPKLLSLFLKRLAGFEIEINAEGLGYEVPNGERDQTAGDPARSYIEQIKLANKEVVTLFDLSREFGSSSGLEEMLSLFTLKIKGLVPFDTCAVYLLDSTRRSATAVHVEGKNKELIETRRIKVGEGVTGFVLSKEMAVKNVNPDLDFSVSLFEIIEQYSTMASIPLVFEGEMIGAVSVYSIDLESYDEEHLRVLETTSKIASEAISKWKLHAETMSHALTDPMTGLPNARSLQIQFNKELQRAARSGISFQVLVLDLDGFKAVNDTFGHKAGDEMLRGVGRVISEQLREYDFLARYGGDEFVALIPEAGQEQVADLCARIEAAVSSFRLEIDSTRYASVGVSVGAAGCPEDGQTFDQMVIAADKVMYDRKVSRKQRRLMAQKAQTAPLSEMLAQSTEYGSVPAPLSDGQPLGEGIVVELDETAVVTSAAIN